MCDLFSIRAMSVRYPFNSRLSFVFLNWLNVLCIAYIPMVPIKTLFLFCGMVDRFRKT